jgi:hypothetical protein
MLGTGDRVAFFVLALALWGAGTYFTYIAVSDVGLEPALLIAVGVQVSLTVFEKVCIKQLYEHLRGVPQKIAFVVAFIALGIDTALNAVGIFGMMANVQLVGDVAAWIISIIVGVIIAVTVEVLLLLARS